MVKKLQALKAKKGFTLVELIVVIAIIGVLAAILVPTMMNVVTKARVSSADQTAKALADSVTQWLADLEANRGTIVDGTISFAVPAGGTLADANLTIPAGIKRNGDNANAKALLLDDLNTNYPFKGGEVGVIYIGTDRHVLGAVYSDDGVADGTALAAIVTSTNFTNNKVQWKSASQEGIDATDSKIIGTNPKLPYGT